jgi:hypothetical protein
MSDQHHVTQAERTPLGARQHSPEEKAHMADLQRQIDDHDVVMRSMQGTRDDNPSLAEAQDARNALQFELNDLSNARSVVTTEDVQKRDAMINEERDQLVLAQNAPFTAETPIAQGGEAAVPEGFRGSDPRVSDTDFLRPNTAGVLHHGVEQPAGTTTTTETK